MNQYVQYAQDSDSVFDEETYGNLRKRNEKFRKVRKVRKRKEKLSKSRESGVYINDYS